MTEVERDPTDVGVSWMPSEEDLAQLARARREGLIAADVPSGPPATTEHRARVLDRMANQHGWTRGRGTRRPKRPCSQCGAAAGQWCRTSPRSERRFGFAHPERDETDQAG